MKKLLEVGFVVGIVLITGSVFTPITFLNREKYQGEIRSLYERVEPGMTADQVRQAFGAPHYPDLRFHQDDDQRWFAAAPFEFGAQNWVLLIEFKGGHVSAVRVRTEDSDRYRPAEAPADKVAQTDSQTKRMPDGKQWTITNLNVHIDPSYCYDDAEANCRRYGRLYTWQSAQRACQSFGDRWRLPTDAEWRQLAKYFGGIREDSSDSGKAAYTTLLTGGGSGFNAVLGGNRGADDSRYARLEAHGFYWTASENDPASALFYNFARGSQSFNRQSGGDKQMAISVRCVRD
jgi:uncharacterized protein (TIGR02145 family)